MNDTVRFSGKTMGSDWQVQIACPIPPDDRQILQAGIEMLLRMINGRMSTYQQDSEICAFNRYQGTETVLISPEMRHVLTEALSICRLTDGIYDITVAPLVELWGFGPTKITHYPDREAVNAALQHVGYQHLHLNEYGLAKDDAAVRIDLSSIAKGYGVDKLAMFIEQYGYHDYLVEIGGEIRLTGHYYDQPWKIAIECPQWDGGFTKEFMTFAGVSQAIATSGSYRNYSRLNGGFAAHEIDSETGYTKASSLLSVTVLADNCMKADGYATALYLLGDNAYPFACRYQIPAVFMAKDDRQEQGYRIITTPAFKKLLESTDERDKK